MTLVVAPESNIDPSFVATKGFGGLGASKIGAGIQAGRLAYRTAKYAYKRYFGYATRTRSRAIGTATGAGIGIGSGLVAIWTTPTPSTYQNGQARSYMVQSKSKRLQRCIHQSGPRRKLRR